MKSYFISFVGLVVMSICFIKFMSLTSDFQFSFDPKLDFFTKSLQRRLSAGTQKVFGDALRSSNLGGGRFGNRDGEFRKKRRWRKNLRNKLLKGLETATNVSTTAEIDSTTTTIIENTNSDLFNPIAALSCLNQTKCIQPVLQLKEQFKVYYCKHVGHGVRFYFLVKEGLLLHPNIHLVSSPEEADVVIYLPVSADWHKTECRDPLLRNKTVVLDEGDYPQLFHPEDGAGPFLQYFKRSYVRRSNGLFQGFMNYVSSLEVLPMTYTLMEAYVRSSLVPAPQRDLQLLCSLRGSGHDPVRLRVRQWVQEYAKARGLTRYQAGEVNFASRTVVSTDYFSQMHHAQVIVTSNPSHWEGDFRLCEALASGALVLVDTMFVPRPAALLDHRHLVLYDNANKTDLFEQLDRYRGDPAAASRVATEGYLHAMRFHRAANLVDYVFRSLQVKRLFLQQRGRAGSAEAVLGSLAGLRSLLEEADCGYRDTGYHLRLAAVNMPPPPKTSSRPLLFQ